MRSPPETREASRPRRPAIPIPSQHSLSSADDGPKAAVTLLPVVRDALARIVAARCELECGDSLTADMILEGLEIELVGLLDHQRDRRAA